MDSLNFSSKVEDHGDEDTQLPNYVQTAERTQYCVSSVVAHALE